MGYKVVDLLDNHVIVLDIDNVGRVTFPLPIVDGKYPSGKALTELLDTYGSSVVSNAKPVPVRASNEDEIIALIGIDVISENRKRAIKAKRDKILARTDYTQISDSVLSVQEIEAWKEYRQALRDITEQPGYPNSVVWPVPPSIPRTAFGAPMTDALGNPVNL